MSFRHLYFTFFTGKVILLALIKLLLLYKPSPLYLQKKLFAYI
jgi:hypothetical protein